jgi:hypothetical protein
MRGPIQEKATEVLRAQFLGSDGVIPESPVEKIADISPTPSPSRFGGAPRSIEMFIELVEFAPGGG